MSSQDSIPDEVWMPIVGYEDYYSVSNYGRVRRDKAVRCKAGRILKTQITRLGYPMIRLYKNNVGQTHYIHRFVAAAFLGPCPDGYCVNHKDNDRRNNHISNLEYVTPKQNSQHAAALGVFGHGENHYNSVLTEEDVKRIRKVYAEGGHNFVEIAQWYGVHRVTIRSVVRRTTWAHVE